MLAEEPLCDDGLVGLLAAEGASPRTRDVSARKRAEAERQVIFDVIEGVNTTANLDELLRLIHRSIRRVLYAENCFVALYDPATGLFEKPFYVDQLDSAAPPQKTAKSCTAHVFRTGRPLLMTPEVFRQLVGRGEVEVVGTPPAAWLGVPLKTPAETVGVLVVQHYRDERAYSERDLGFLSSVGGQIALAIERKRAEEALRESEEKFRSFVETTGEWIWAMDVGGRMTYNNPAIETILGYRPEELLGKDTLAFMHEDDRREVEIFLPELIAGRRGWSNLVARWRHKDGTYRYLESNATPAINAGGELAGYRGTDRDITERIQAQEAVVEANRRAITEYECLLGKISSLAQGVGTARDLTTVFRTLRDFAARSAPCDALFISLYDPERQQRTATYGWADGEEMDVTHLPPFPVSESGFVGRAVKTQTVSITGDYKKEMEGRFTVFVETRRSDCEVNSALVAPMTLKGVTVGVVEVLSYERTAFRGEHRTAMQMAANLAAIAVENVRLFEREREREEQLRQSQKMEAVGKLAGGVAHDFNNLLTAINGYSDLSLRRLGGSDPVRRNVEEIKKAGDRAAGLTRQLLAFSRKQVLQPKVLNLNAIVADISNMLRRLIGEDITLFVKPDPCPGQIKADPSQLEQVLMNLAVNARDAMPTGGKLTVETANVYLDAAYASRHVAVTPGHYVMLAVSDTGCGMDEETRARVFEPFFTTKEVGKGTGLGLSTVYGIIKQSGGNIWVYSELNLGTTFKIYLPQVREDDGESERAILRSEAPHGRETVLLAEDEEMVREMTTEVLRESGYHVLVARHGKDALRVAAEYGGTIHLLLSDVVMPQMSGRDLVERLAPERPAMRVLYMSGYTDDAIVRHGILDPGTEFIEKPFTPNQIVLKVRAVLDGRQN